MMSIAKTYKNIEIAVNLLHINAVQIYSDFLLIAVVLKP